MLTDETCSAEEHELRRRLKKQHFSAKGPAMFVISTAGIAEDGWTIYVNGVVDLGLMITVDDLGFLHVVPASTISKTQRRGRVGRVANGVYCCLTEEVSECDERLSYAEDMQVTLAAASLGVPWPPAAMQGVTSPHVAPDLCRMGLLLPSQSGSRSVTSLGQQMLRGHVDVLSNVFISATQVLGIETIGRIATALLSTKMEVFRDVFQATSDFGLSTSQVALGETVGFPGEKVAKLYGDIHTAVALYLKWVCGSISRTVEALLRIACFRKMSAAAPSLTPDDAKSLLAQPNWRPALTIALAYAYQRNILHPFGDTEYKGSSFDRNAVRLELELSPMTVSLSVSRRSLCHPSYSASGWKPWVVYAGTGRFPHAKSVTHLPTNIAAWFTHHDNIHWDLEGVSPASFSAAMAAAMNSGDTSALKEVVRYFESVGDSSTDATITDAGSRVSLSLEKHDVDRLAQDDASEALQNSASIGTGSAHEACASENTLNTQEGVTLHSARQTQTMLLRDVCGVLRKN